MRVLPTIMSGVQMNWEAIGAIGEITGAVAVFASLVYLAVQIRQNTRAIRGSAERETVSLQQSALQPVAASLELADVHGRGLFQFHEMSPAEQIQFHRTMTALFQSFESAFYQRRASLIGGEIYSRIVKNIEGWLRFPGVNDWWNTFAREYSDEFKVFVENEVRPGVKLLEALPVVEGEEVG